MRLTPLVLACGVSAFAVVAPAHAQPATAQAEVLFRDGKRLISEGNITAACDAFEGSFKIDASPSTLMNLADCRERNQQYASAWAHFVETARLARMNPALQGLAAAAKERATTVEAKLSYLIVNVPDEARIAGLSITRDGITVDPIQWNRDIPIDGGTYKIEGKAPAYEPWTTTVTVGNAKDKQSVNVPRFREAEPRAATTVRTQRTRVSLAAGIVWIAGCAGVASGIGLEIMSRDSYYVATVSSDNARRHEMTDKANRQRDAAMIVGAVGAAAIGAGVYLWIRDRPTESRITVTPNATGESAGLTVQGSF